MKKLKKAINSLQGTFRLAKHSSSLGSGLVWVPTVRRGLIHLKDIPKHETPLAWSEALPAERSSLLG